MFDPKLKYFNTSQEKLDSSSQVVDNGNTNAPFMQA